jgi:hypothetical protein
MSRSARAPSALRAITCNVYFPFAKNGSCGMTPEPAKKPIRGRGNDIPQPSMRISTLATLLVVSTLPLTVSPGLKLRLEMLIDKIFGGACGAPYTYGSVPRPRLGCAWPPLGMA